MGEPVAVDFNGEGVPARVVYRETEYEVIDMPTRLEDELFFVTHPLDGIHGWRFIGRDPTGETRNFALRECGSAGQWEARVRD
jgi:hypothetical protein